MNNENLLVGLDTSDDAAVYKIGENKAIIHTADFFTPIVDDPYFFGQIAASNALSDIYAMGGKPLMALNIVVFPEELAMDLLPEILRGGADKVVEAGAVIGGGHSIKGDEPIYGLSVMGEVAIENIYTNSNAKPGDTLILTKPLGTGIATTALKNDEFGAVSETRIIEVMAALNKNASEAAVDVGVSSITDVTGFGLLGHAIEMAEASKVTFKINTESLPILHGVRELAARGFVPGGLCRNKAYFESKVMVARSIPDNLLDICFDPQTSGGLLISVQRDKAQELLKKLREKSVTEAVMIGEVCEPSDHKVLLDI